MKLRLGVAVLVVALSGCVPAVSENSPAGGSITLRNASSDHIVWVNGSPAIGLDAILAGRTSWVSMPPDGSMVRGSNASVDDPEWCEDDNRMHWILRRLDGQALPVSGTQLASSEIEIVDTVGPGHCWGEEDATWVFSGNG